MTALTERDCYQGAIVAILEHWLEDLSSGAKAPTTNDLVVLELLHSLQRRAQSEG